MLVALTNGICVEYYMAPQAYNFVNTHDHEILGWKIISKIIHAQAPNIVGMICDIQSDLSTLAFNKKELFEDFNIRIIRL